MLTVTGPIKCLRCDFETNGRAALPAQESAFRHHLETAHRGWEGDDLPKPAPPAETTLPAKPLPCPFCGRRPSVAKGKRYKTGGMWHKPGEWMWSPAVKCSPCGIERRGESVDEVLGWWNTRA